MDKKLTRARGEETFILMEMAYDCQEGISPQGVAPFPEAVPSCLRGRQLCQVQKATLDPSHPSGQSK